MNILIKILLLLLGLLSLNCRKPRVTTGTTFFKAHGILQIPTDGLARQKADLQTFDGVYLPFFELTRSPALLFIDRGKSLACVALRHELEAVAGDFVQVTGTMNDDTHPAASLVPERWQVVHASHPLLELAVQHYEAMKEKLSRTAPPSSKLHLPERPDWLLVVDESRQCAVAFFNAADLMHGVDINLVYDLATARLKAVYVDRFFKGE